MPTIGLVANVFNECNALPGWLETHLPFFDDVRVYHAGPDGIRSVDGTLDILKKWGVPVEFGTIDVGFGTVRTNAIRSSPCDWVMLLDADERFLPLNRIMTCGGQATPQAEVDAILATYDFRDLANKTPDWDNVARLGGALVVEHGVPYDAGVRLREIIGEFPNYDAIATPRRHWHDLTLKRPTQNWQTHPDWQLRLVRNHPSIYYEAATRMHERLVGANRVVWADVARGPFFDHFHFHFKRMEVAQRAHDIAIYDAIHEGRKPPTWKEFQGTM